uniref:Cl3646_1 n=1 Tax=Arundo donax TaxID=35708 RepID=A0A0A9E4H9_ARUDO
MCCKSPNPVSRLSARWLARNFLTTEMFQDVHCTTAKMYLVRTE